VRDLASGPWGGRLIPAALRGRACRRMTKFV